MSVEQIQNIEKQPSLESIAQKTQERVNWENELLVEWIPQMEAICERNPEAMKAFLEKYIKIETV